MIHRLFGSTQGTRAGSANAQADRLAGLGSRLSPRHMTRSAELCVLLARGYFPPDAQSRARDMMSANMDWGQVVDCAMRQEVFPLVYRNLRSLGYERVPSPIFRELEAAYRGNVLRSDLLARELCRLLAVFACAGVRAMPLKGVGLSDFLYGDHALRVSGDLDILVAPEEVSETIAALCRSGYGPTMEDRIPGDVCRLNDMEYQLGRRESKITYTVEVHWALVWGASVDQSFLADLWREAGLRSFLGTSVLGMSPEWELMFLAAHAARHRWRGLKWLADIHDLCSLKAIDWRKLDEKASIFGWHRLLGDALDATAALFGVSLPEQFAARLRPVRAAVYLRPVSPLDPVHAMWYLSRRLDGPLKRFRYVTRHLFRPTLVDRDAIRLPHRLQALHYVIRPFRLLLKFPSWHLQRVLSTWK